MTKTHCFPYRPHDYIYDPLFTVSGPTDHYKAAIIAKMSSVKYQICPIFPNMFSELPNRPATQLVPRRTARVPKYKPRHQPAYDPAQVRKVDVAGADRSKFFCHVVNFPPKDIIPFLHFPTFTIEKVVKKVMKASRLDEATQTVYRDSSAQTIPWEPPFTVIGEGDPEILKLEFLKWGSGLPAGVQDIKLIERARMKRSWEKYMEQCSKDTTMIDGLKDIIEAIERDEWAFREKEIQEIQDLRLNLLEKMLNELHAKSKERFQTRLQNVISVKEAERDEKLEKIRKKTARELRKIGMRERGFPTKYKEMNVIDEHADVKSELYAPLCRHGEHPKRWHQVIDERMRKYRTQYIGVENFSTLPCWIEKAMTQCTRGKLNPLCPTVIKWTTPVLQQLHMELLEMRRDVKKRPITLRTKIDTHVSELFTAEVEGIPDDVEEVHQAMIRIQSIIKGRASQMIIYEGRDRCRELINELKTSQGLLKDQKRQKNEEKWRIKGQQREEAKANFTMQSLKATLAGLRGSIVGSLLDFLNKELRRLLEERKAHAMCKLNERERYSREADEAGRRQKEMRRRREHDEMFKQIVKINQETVDLYLRSIVTEGMEFSSEAEAITYIAKLADKIEQETEGQYELEKAGAINEDETLADLVHHFLLPEVAKMQLRQKIQQQQKQNLRTIHESIFSQLEEIPRTKEPKHVASLVTATHTELLSVPLSGALQRSEDSLERTEKYVQDILLDMGAQLLEKRALEQDMKQMIMSRVMEHIAEMDMGEQEEGSASLQELYMTQGDQIRSKSEGGFTSAEETTKKSRVVFTETKKSEGQMEVPGSLQDEVKQDEGVLEEFMEEPEDHQEMIKPIEEHSISKDEAIEHLEDGGISKDEAIEELEDPGISKDEAIEELEDPGISKDEATEQLEDHDSPKGVDILEQPQE